MRVLVCIALFVTATLYAQVPIIPTGQTRIILSSTDPGQAVGSPIFASNSPVSWSIISETNPAVPGVVVDEFYFSIDNMGQLFVLQPLDVFFPSPLRASAEVTLSVRAFNNFGASADVNVSVFIVDDPGTVDLSVFINDQSLLRCIRETLGVTVISISAADTLTHLDCLCRNDQAITEITGMHLFENLEYLNLSNNMIEDIRPLSGLAVLKDLRLAGNLINDVTTSNPLASMVDLVTLDLSDNQIRETNAFSTLDNIEFLSLENNDICDIQSLAALAAMPNSGINTGDTVILDGNHLISNQALADIGAIQSAGAFVTFTGQTPCPPTPDLVVLGAWPNKDVLDFAHLLNIRGGTNCSE